MGCAIIRLNIFPKILNWVIKLAAVKKRIFPLISQTGITYSGNYLVNESSIGKVKAGVRMPFFIFSDGKQIFDYLAGSAFKILFFGADEKNGSAQLTGIKIKFVSYSFQEIPASLFGAQKDFYILLRPDNHISYIGNDINKCREVLDKIAHNLKTSNNKSEKSKRSV